MSLLLPAKHIYLISSVNSLQAGSTYPVPGRNISNTIRHVERSLGQHHVTRIIVHPYINGKRDKYQS